MKAVRKLVCGLLAAGGVIAVVVMIGLRTKCTPVLTVVRRANRLLWNPRAMQTAGAPGAYASVIRHVGRTSGRSYETPIAAIATDDGFVIGGPANRRAQQFRAAMGFRGNGFNGCAVILRDDVATTDTYVN